MSRPELKLLVSVYLVASDQGTQPIKRPEILRKVKDFLEEEHRQSLLAHATSKKGKDGKQKKKQDFNIRSLNTYFSEFFSKGDFSPIQNQFGDYLAIYCGFKDYDDFLRKQPDHDESLMQKGLRKILPNFTESPGGHEAGKKDAPSINDYYEKLEFETSGMRINCISYILYWAYEQIPQKTEAILKTGNQYRYILTESAGEKNMEKIAELIDANPRLADFIKIRTLYDKKLFKDLIKGGVCFPLSNDIVLYERWDEKLNDFKFKKAIVGVKPLGNGDAENNVVEIEFHRGEDLLYWFKKTWEKLDLPEPEQNKS